MKWQRFEEADKMKRLAILMDPIEKINPKKDSSLALLLAASRAGYALYYGEMADLIQEDGEVYFEAYALSVQDSLHHYFECGKKERLLVKALDYFLIRKNPPLTLSYLYMTYLLEFAAQAGPVKMINQPQALRNLNEKIHTHYFPEYCPPSLITSSKQAIKTFALKHERIIVKPLNAMGGMGIFCFDAQDPNLAVAVDLLTEYGQTPIMAQAFLPAVFEGDTRILLLHGKPLPYTVLRKAAVGEFRSNLAAGGKASVLPLTTAQEKLALTVGKKLLAEGVYFAGLDVIGDYLTEINVTSPTCLREIERETGLAVADDFFAAFD